MLSQSALLLVLLALATCSGVVQGVNHKGNEFQIVFGPNLGSSDDPILVVTTDEEGVVSFWVAYNMQGVASETVVNATYTVQKGSVTTITIPANLEIIGGSADLSKAITLKAYGDNLLTVVGVNEEPASTDAFLALPKVETKSKTYEYFVMAFESSNLAGSETAESFFAIITNEEDTTITINPKVQLIYLFGGQAVFRAGIDTTATVSDKGAVFAASERTDLTGSRIVSNKPLTLISGHECGNVPNTVVACDHLVESFPPTETWGFKFFLVPFTTRASYLFRIMASRDGTQCQITCNDDEGNPNHSETIALDAGNFKQLTYTNNRSCCVECNLPCLVAQYSLSWQSDDNRQSDPFMSMIPPLQQFSKDYDTIFFESQQVDSQDVPVQFDAQFNLVLPEECSPSGLRFDGNPLSGVTFVDIKCNDGLVCGRAAEFNPSVNTGVHRVTHTDPNCKFMFIVYGWDRENTYGYVAGMEVDPIAATTFCLKESSLTVSEGDGVVMFTATRSGTVGSADCIGVAVMDITTQGTDYETPPDCCFAAGEREASCSITLVSDSTAEPDEMFNIRLNPSSGQCICEAPGGPNITVTIIDMAPLTFALEDDVYTVNETACTVRIGVVKKSGTISAGTTETYRVTPQEAQADSNGAVPATEDDDYNSAAIEVVFQPGDDIKFVDIPITVDSKVERTIEYFLVELSKVSGEGQVVAPSQASVFIQEPVTNISFENATYQTSESVVTYNGVRLVSSEPFAEDTQVTISFEDITATGGANVSASGVDYGNNSVVVTFAAGSTFSSFASIPINDDGPFPPEGDEQFRATFGIPQGYNIQKDDPSEAVVTITEEALAITVGFDPVVYNVSEDSGSAVAYLIASSPSPVAYDVTVTTQDGTAVGGDDYTDGSYTATFQAGSTTASVSIPIANDSVLEFTECFNKSLTISQETAELGVSVGPADTATCYILDNDAVTVQFNPTQYTVNEGDGEVVLTLVATAAASFDYTVDVDTVDGTAVGQDLLTSSGSGFIGGVDFQSGGYQTTFLAGETTATVTIPIINDAIAEGTEDFTAVLTISQATADLGVSVGAANTSTVNIEDNDPVTCEFNPTQYTVNEGDGEVVLTLVASGAASFDYTCDVDTVDGTAVGGADFQSGGYQATFLAGETTAAVTIPIINDAIAEASEDFTAVLTISQATADLGVSVGAADTATVNIEDNDPVTVQFNPTQYTVNEGDGEAVLTLEASAAASFAYTVDVDTVDGTAVGGADFQSGGYQATFLAGETTATVTIPIINDTIAECTEDFTAVLTISQATADLGVSVGAADTATVNIEDNDPVTCEFNPTLYTVNEGDGEVVLTLVASGAASFDYTCDVDTVDGTAVDPDDYTGGKYMATFAAGSTTATVTIPIVDDDCYDGVGVKTFSGVLSVPPNATEKGVRAGTETVATVNVADDEPAPEVNFAPTTYQVLENAGYVTSMLVASGPACEDYDVTVATRDGSAVSPDDYLGGQADFTFKAGETKVSLNITIVDDDILEGDESFFCDLTLPMATSDRGITLGSDTVATTTILDVEGMIAVNFVPTVYDVSEDAGNVTLMLVASGTAAEAYTVYVDTRDGSATSPDDYTGGRYMATFAAGNTTATVTIPISPPDDCYGGLETFFGDLVIPPDATAKGVSTGTETVATVNVADDEPAPEVSFAPTAYQVLENASYVTSMLVASGPACEDYDVTVATRNGSAVSPDDYLGGQADFTFKAGETKVSLNTTIKDDDILERGEIFFCDLTLPMATSDRGITLGSDTVATTTILDDDTIEVNFNPTQYTVNESDGSVTLTLTAGKAAAFDYTVEVLTQDGTATAPSDYQAGPYSVTFSAGSTTATVTIPIVNDDVYEGKTDPEDFTATISTANTGFTNISAGDNDTATISILDDEVNEISFENATYSTLETVGNYTEVRLVSSLPFPVDCDFNVSFADITATGGPNITVDGVDYGNSSVTVTFAAGQTVSSAVSIPIMDDQVFEPSEQFRATFELPSGVSNLQKGIPSEAVVTIQESETLTVEFDPTEYSVSEADPSANLVIKASLPASFDYDVTFTTVDVSTTAGDDYIGGTFTVTIPAGQTQVTHPVFIIEDFEVEGTETFQAQLAIPSASADLGVTLGDGHTATVNIDDDDGVVVTFNLTKYTVNEGDREVVLTLVANLNASFDYTVEVDTVNGAAVGQDVLTSSGSGFIDDGDFQSGGYSVTFPAGETTATVTIPISDDDIAEGTEDFSAVLTIPAAASSLDINKGADDTASICITDNDAVEVDFNPTQYTVNEGAGAVTLTLTANRVAECNYTVEILTQDGSATAPSDYQSGPYSVTFTAGSTTATVDIPIVDDGVYEGNCGAENFTATISTINAGGCDVSAGDDSTATVFIEDNDDLTVQFNPAMYSVLESAGSVTLTLETDKPFECPFSVGVNTTDGTAVAPDDYIAGGFTAEFNPNSQQSSVSVVIIDDTPLQEGIENFTASISISQELQNANIHVGTNDMATVNILDVVVDVECGFDPSSYRVSEEEGFAFITVVCNKALSVPYTLQVTTSDGTATAGADYADDTYDVVIDANETTDTFIIPIMDDTVCEEDENFFGNLVIPAAARAFGVGAGPATTATITIEDNDIAGVQFDPVQYMVREDAGNAVLMLVSNVTCQFNYSVTVEVSNGTAAGGLDFGSGPFTATFPAGSSTSSVSVPIIDDQLQENNETFTAQLQIPSDIQDSVVGGANTEAQVTIKDNEDDIIINFNPSQYDVPEDGQFVTLTLVSSRPSTVPYNVTVHTKDGTAQAPGDYTGGPYFTVEFPAGQTTAMVQVPIVNDAEPCECVEDFTAGIEVPDASAALGVVVGVNDTAAISITDDEICPITFNPEQYSVAEDVQGGTVEVCLMVERNCIGDFSVMLQTTDGTATVIADFGGGPFTVTFEPDENMACTNIPIVVDEIFEGDQNFFVDIVVPPEVPLNPEGRANVTIVDDDTDVFCSVEENSVTVDESQGGVLLDITISREVETPFICEIETRPISAEEQDDFTPITKTITFEPQADTTQEVFLEIVDDNIAENPESLQLVVQDVNGQGNPVPVNITIIDDDQNLECLISDSLEILSFMGAIGYDFSKTCEYQLVSSCTTSDSQVPLTIVADYKNDNFEMGTIGIKWKEETVIINEDNTLLSSGTSSGEVTTISNDTFITVEIPAAGVTVEKRLGTESSLTISVSSTSDLSNQLCGLCGDREGTLRLKNGEVAADTTQFIAEYAVDPMNPILPGPVRDECVDNTTTIGDPLYEVPLSLPEETVEKYGQLSLCYEVHGKANRSFNLISDTCVSVNALYVPMKNPAHGNVIGKIAILAADTKGKCQEIVVDLEGCTASMNGKVLASYKQDGIHMMHRRTNKVRVTSPNCENSDLVLWVTCEVREKEPMIKLTVSRGMNLRPTCHGLIGQFWNIDVTAEKYNVTSKDLATPNPNHFAVTVKTPAGDQRRFFAELYQRTWDLKDKPCLYAGSSQGGKTKEVASLPDSVIEGDYTQYMVDSLFSPNFKYSQFKSQCPTEA